MFTRAKMFCCEFFVIFPASTFFLKFGFLFFNPEARFLYKSLTANCRNFVYLFEL